MLYAIAVRQITKTKAEISDMKDIGYDRNIGLSIAMETVKSLPFAEVRQITNHKIDLQLTKKSLVSF